MTSYLWPVATPSGCGRHKGKARPLVVSYRWWHTLSLRFINFPSDVSRRIQKIPNFRDDSAPPPSGGARSGLWGGKANPRQCPLGPLAARESAQLAHKLMRLLEDSFGRGSTPSLRWVPSPWGVEWPAPIARQMAPPISRPVITPIRQPMGDLLAGHRKYSRRRVFFTPSQILSGVLHSVILPRSHTGYSNATYFGYIQKSNFSPVLISHWLHVRLPDKLSRCQISLAIKGNGEG